MYYLTLPINFIPSAGTWVSFAGPQLPSLSIPAAGISPIPTCNTEKPLFPHYFHFFSLQGQNETSIGRWSVRFVTVVTDSGIWDRS